MAALGFVRLDFEPDFEAVQALWPNLRPEETPPENLQEGALENEND
jgi:hypothetical protein